MCKIPLSFNLKGNVQSEIQSGNAMINNEVEFVNRFVHTSCAYTPRGFVRSRFEPSSYV